MGKADELVYQLYSVPQSETRPNVDQKVACSDPHRGR